MKISDSTVTMYTVTLGQDPHQAKEHAKNVVPSTPKAGSSANHPPAAVTDTVNFSMPARSGDNQAQVAAVDGQGVSSGTDQHTRTSEAIIQLFEMLTGIKVGMLKQSDLADVAAVENKIRLLRQEAVKQTRDAAGYATTPDPLTATSAAEGTGTRLDPPLTLEISLDGKPVTHGGTTVRIGSVSRSGTGITLSGDVLDNGTVRRFDLAIRSDIGNKISEGSHQKTAVHSAEARGRAQLPINGYVISQGTPQG